MLDLQSDRSDGVSASVGMGDCAHCTLTPMYTTIPTMMVKGNESLTEDCCDLDVISENRSKLEDSGRSKRSRERRLP